MSIVCLGMRRARNFGNSVRVEAMKILITGSTGLVGSRIVELLSPRYEFTPLLYEDGFDLTDAEAVREALARSDADGAIHLAAYTNVSEAHKQNGNKEGDCYRINVLGTQNIAEACASLGKYLIHFSTDFVFDGEKENLYTEEDKPSPMEWYGATKLWAEEEVRSFGEDWVILRIAYPFRAKFAPKKDVPRTIVEGFSKGRLHPMFTDQRITPTFIDDIARALGVFLDKRPLGIYHVVGSTVLSPYDLALRIAEIFGFDKNLVKPGSLEEYLKKDPRPRQRFLGLSNAKLKKDLGVKMGDIDTALKALKGQMEDLRL